MMMDVCGETEVWIPKLRFGYRLTGQISGSREISCL